MLVFEGSVLKTMKWTTELNLTNLNQTDNRLVLVLNWS
jgi:hypothetical protein